MMEQLELFSFTFSIESQKTKNPTYKQQKQKLFRQLQFFRFLFFPASHRSIQGECLDLEFSRFSSV